MVTVPSNCDDTQRFSAGPLVDHSMVVACMSRKWALSSSVLLELKRASPMSSLRASL
jgi:hypothetical protein